MAQSWSFKHISLTINGVLLSGFDDSGTIEFTEEASATATFGADGKLTLSKNSTDHVNVGITLKQTSPSIAYLNELMRAARISPVQIPQTLSFYDQVSGTVYGGRAYFLGMDANTIGKEAGAIKFNMVLENGRDTKILNALSFG